MTNRGLRELLFRGKDLVVICNILSDPFFPLSSQWESRVTQYERDFERISTVVQNEVIWFEKEKSKDFKNQVIRYLETLLYLQQLAKY